MSKSDPIAIVGMSCLFPGASHLDNYWHNMCQGSAYTREVPADRWNHSAFYSEDRRNLDTTYARKIACLDDIRSFSPEQYGMPPRRAYPMDPQQRLFLEQTRIALDDAGYRGRRLPKSTGVYVGASASEYSELVLGRFRARQLLDGDWGRVPPLPADAFTNLAENIAPLQKYSMVGLQMNMIACNVSAAFDLQGPALVMDSACSSALLAVHTAVLHLRAGICDAAIVGGVYTICTPDKLIAFSRIGALSRNDECRPFDASADGFVLGEGAGVILLKRLDEALHDRDHIWAVVRGIGLNNDGRGDGPMTPRLSGQMDALARAYLDADIPPDTVGYIEAHGTATPVGDLTEIAALKESFKASSEGAAHCAISSVKGNIGHTLAASGIAGLIRAVLATKHRVIPPQAGLRSVRPELGLEGSGFHIPDAPESFETRKGVLCRAGVSAFGFGGTNVHVVVEESPQSAQRKAMFGVSAPEESQLFVISAATPSFLAKHLNDLIDVVTATATPLSDLAFTLTVGRRRDSARVAFVASSRAHLLEMLKKSIAAAENRKCEGIYYAPEPLPENQRRIGFLFPGEELRWSQDRPHSCRRLASFKAWLDAIVAGMGRGFGRPTDSYPESAHNGNGIHVSNEGNGAAQCDCQTALNAMQLTLADFFTGLGLQPRAAACAESPNLQNGGRAIGHPDANIIIQCGQRGQFGGANAPAGMARVESGTAISTDTAHIIDVFQADKDFSESLLDALGELVTRGVPLNLSSLFSRARMVSLPSPSYPARRYWVVSEPRRSERVTGFTPTEFDAANASASEPEEIQFGFADRVVLAADGGGIDVALGQKVLNLIVQLTAFPAESLKLELSFTADLGFDSLMWIDFYDALLTAIPEAHDLPESLIRPDTTVGDLIREVSATVGRHERARQGNLPDAEIQRNEAVHVDRPFLDNEIGATHAVTDASADRASGEVVTGAGIEAKPAFENSEVIVSSADLPWLNDHELDGRILLPLAVSLDYAAASAARLGLGPGFALSEVRAPEAILVPRTGFIGIQVATVRNRDAVEIQISSGDGNKHRPSVTVRARTVSEALPVLVPPPGGKAPELPIAEFYERLNFHGPRLRALHSVLEVGPQHCIAQICVPVNSEGPRGSALDILALDGMMQACAYWASIHLAATGMPVAADEIRVLARPEAGVAHSVVWRVRTAADNDLRGDLDLLDSEKRPLLQIRGLHCRAIQRRVRSGENRQNPAATLTKIDSSSWRIQEFPEVKALEELIQNARSAGIESPYFSVHERVTNETSVIGGREYVNFASYNYLGLSGDPGVTGATIEAIARYGTSVSASRLVSGEKPLHGELEHEIAEFLGCQDAVVFVSGHATNVSVIGHMFGAQDLVIHDSLAHDSILTGIRLSGAKRHAFPHNDADALDQLLCRTRHTARRVLIAVEAVYSMDGDIAPLARIVEIKRRHNALLLVDEAHSLGVLGQSGRGIGEHCGIPRGDVEFWMGTLSKSLASCGGYIAGSKELVHFLKYSNPGFVYSVGMSPANTAAALAALRKLRASPEIVATLRERSKLFLDLSRARGIDTGSSEATPIIPCIVGNSFDSMRLSHAMADRGINVQPILYPAVEEHMARLRFFVTARHTEQQIRAATDALAEELHRIDPKHLTARPFPESYRSAAKRTGS